MLLAQSADTTILLVAAALFLAVNIVVLVVFAPIFVLWLQAFMSGTPVPMVAILGMRLRRTDANTVVKSLIMARHAGIALTWRQVEQAYLQGADLVKIILAMIKAKKQGLDLTLEELVEADLEDRLAEKLGQQGSSVDATVGANDSQAGASEHPGVRICGKCGEQVFDDNKICRNCGAIL